ncbi:aminopeptidase N isoform X2 [Anoplophora glabripennis]|uniref:aminopeptidase N isoform X2 n=1 Tax=Anoplophora glabripennis TaxID=217634 RepID=UPI0008753B38|nr:aminopeptidase N isoform X2 [Anoplophora glabripennis]
MVSYYNQGVPTTVDLENNSNQKKYTINRSSGKGLVISKPLCVLMAIGALLLAVLVGLIVFFLVPRYCNGEETPEALVKNQGISEATSTALSIEDDSVDERLPRSIEPTHYRMQIAPNFYNSTTSGAETITLKAIEDTNLIIFHVNNITIDKHSVIVKSTKFDSKPIEINDQDYIQGQKYRIHLNEQLKKGEEYQLDMKFNGELNKHLQGFYRSQYNDRLGNERYTASTQFSPTDARRAFPCFDEPSFKAKFTISLARPSNMTTLSNMPLTTTVQAVEQNETLSWDHYPETPKMSTYLVAFIVSNLKPLSINTNGIIKVWAREEFLPYARYAAEIAPQILDYFEKYFGILYPLPKMDIVAVPEFGFSAMENWGLITFRESSLLFDPSSSTNEDMRTIATVLSHEIAHQWFGNLVTPKWWNDLWLKEGFASYLQYFGVNYTEPKWKIADEFIATETQKAMNIDALESSRPISFEVKNSRQIRQAFDDISYSKGAAIIRMMNHFLGEEVFKNGLINFLKKHQNGNADRQDLFTSLTTEAHDAGVLLQNETVKHIMDTWTEKPGFPLVTARADYENKRLHITQRRFYLNDKEERSSWWVPLSFTTSNEAIDFSDTRPKFWLRGEYEIVEEVDLDEWYLLNLNQTGYFIVNYDEKNWKSLIDHIMDLPPIIRAQLISDSMELARANVLDYDIPLRMIARMAVQDRSIMFVPTLIAFKKLKFLSDILSATPAFGHFEEYHRAIFKSTYMMVTFDDVIDDYITRRIRQTVLEWSCMSPDSTCVHQSRSRFRQLMINNHGVEPNLRGVVYCTAVREGTEIEWDFAYQRYLETQTPSEKNMLLDALGCTKLSWLLSRYVKKLLDDPSIRIQDADRVFESVAKNRVGTQIAFDFLRKNWNELLNHYGDGFNILAKMIKALAPHMNTEFQLSELERFKNSIKTNISTTASAFESAIETVKSNVDWMKKNYNQVEQWFIKNKERFVFL